jgi:signal transduction histidine kinase
MGAARRSAPARRGSFSIPIMYGEVGMPAGLVAAALGIGGLAAWAWRRAERRRRQQVAPPGTEAALGFIATLAHDFNNLLGIVIGNLDLVATLNQDQRLAEPLKSALDTALRAATITRRMSAAAGRQAYRPRPVALDALLRDRLDELQQELGERHPIVTELTSDAMVQVDGDALVDALRELLRNAAQAMPEGGPVRLATRAQAADRASLSVVDTGCGMAPDLLPRAFEPFVTTQRNVRGAGLGLAMVRSFAVQSGGEAALDSALGRGTTAIMHLPVAAPAPTTVAERLAQP